MKKIRKAQIMQSKYQFIIPFYLKSNFNIKYFIFTMLKRISYSKVKIDVHSSIRDAMQIK